MDRKRQLLNVTFGGAWSEQIAGNEALAEAMVLIEGAATRTGYADLGQEPRVDEALAMLCAEHPKGALLSEGWRRALGITNAGLRRAELQRIASLLKLGLGERLRRQ